MPGKLRRFLIACCAIAISAPGFAQASADETTPPQPVKHIPVFGNADEFALGGDFEYYNPLPGFDRRNRDIDLQAATIQSVAHLGRAWEFQFDGLLLRAHGYRTPPRAAPYPQLASNALALGFGPLARWNFLQFPRIRIFLEAGGDSILFDRPWPALGTVNDFFLRAGGGVSLRLSRSYRLESVFHFAHISNGECFCVGNPTWQGGALSLGIRRTFVHEPESENRSGKWFFAKADEGAWLTGVEYYTPQPGLSRRNGSVQADMRQLRIGRAWYFPNRLELQLGGMVQTTNTVFGFAPVLRWYFLDRKQWRLFADGGLDLLQTGSPAFILPWSGVGYNFFPRVRVGTTLRLHESYWLEPSIGWAHVSSGFGWGSQLLPWSGQGVSLSLRHSFGSRTES